MRCRATWLSLLNISFGTGETGDWRVASCRKKKRKLRRFQSRVVSRVIDAEPAPRPRHRQTALGHPPSTLQPYHLHRDFRNARGVQLEAYSFTSLRTVQNGMSEACRRLTTDYPAVLRIQAVHLLRRDEAEATQVPPGNVARQRPTSHPLYACPVPSTNSRSFCARTMATKGAQKLKSTDADTR